MKASLSLYRCECGFLISFLDRTQPVEMTPKDRRYLKNFSKQLDFYFVGPEPLGCPRCKKDINHEQALQNASGGDLDQEILRLQCESRTIAALRMLIEMTRKIAEQIALQTAVIQKAPLSVSAVDLGERFLEAGVAIDELCIKLSAFKQELMTRAAQSDGSAQRREEPNHGGE